MTKEQPAYELILPSPHILLKPLGGVLYDVYRDGGRLFTFTAAPGQLGIIKGNSGQLNITMAQVRK